MFILLAILLPMVVGGLLLACTGISGKAAALLSLLAEAAAAMAFTVGAVTGEKLQLADFGSKVTLLLAPDGLGIFFGILFLAVWIPVTVYTILYITHEGKERRFFGFLLLTLGGMLGVASAGNLVTLYLFFECATLFSMPTVLHSQSRESVAAALKYLFYSMGGAFLGLLGIFAVVHWSTETTFVPGGSIDAAALGDNKTLFLTLVLLAVVGFATKAGMFPMHAWLPTAHPVAPASASALLSGVITKAGVVAVIRLLYYSVGAELLKGSFVQYTLLVLGMITVFMGSMMAYREQVLKKRLAYSTVSNLSYIMLGLFTLSQGGLLGALLHVVTHMAAKTTLFLVVGDIIFTTGKTRVTELRGIGKDLPRAMWAFTFASLSLVGIPPFMGFISKWNLATGALEALPGAWGALVPAILLVSALLTAGYLLPVVVEGFFPGNDWHREGAKPVERGTMTWPILLLGVMTLLTGILASPISTWLSAIVQGALA